MLNTAHPDRTVKNERRVKKLKKKKEDKKKIDGSYRKGKFKKK